MTENEAIEMIKEKACNSRCIPQLCNDGCMYESTKCAFSMAIQALETIKKLSDRKMTTEVLENYMQFEDECVKKGFTFKSVIEAREKQIAKKPITYPTTNRADCPICLNTVRGIDKPFGNYCSKCGQKIDWSDEE